MHVDVLQDLAELGAHGLAGAANEHLVRATCRLALHIVLNEPVGGQVALQVSHAWLAGDYPTKRKSL